jgi:MFS family permease
MSYGVFVVPLEQAFGLTRSQAMLPFSLSMIIWGVTQPFTGAFMDSKGPRKAILLSVMLSALGFVITAGAQSLWQLTLGYGLLVGGATSGLTVAAFSILISRWFQQQRGKVLGYVLAGMRISTLVFSPLAAALIVNWSWQGAFLTWATIMLLIALPVSWLLLQEPTQARETGFTSVLRGGLLFDGEVRQAIKTRAYWMLLVKYFGCGFSAVILTAHLPAMALEHSFSPQQGATALGLVGIGGAVGAMLGGWASDRFGRYKTLAAGYFMRGVGLLLLAFAVSDVTSFYVVSIVAGLPIFFTVAITQLLIYEIFGAGIAGRMIGLIFVLHQVGATIGPYFGGWIFEVTGSYMLALMSGGGVLFYSAFLSWRLQGAARAHIAARTAS